MAPGKASTANSAGANVYRERQALTWCLSLEWFRSRAEAKIVIETWRRHYNEVRPHSSLGYLTPTAFAARLREQEAAACQATGQKKAETGVVVSIKRGPKKLGRSPAFAGIALLSEQRLASPGQTVKPKGRSQSSSW